MRLDRAPSSSPPPLPPSRGLRAAAALLALATLAAAGPACLACDSIACGGGLEWSARAEGGAAVLPGSYAFDVTLEGTRYAFECTVAATAGESACTEPVKVEGSGDFELMVDISQIDPDEWNPEGPVGGFWLFGFDDSDSDDVSSSTRGPTEVRFVVEHDGQPLLDESYEVTYTRDDDFRGEERCGYCDSLEARDATFAQ